MKRKKLNNHEKEFLLACAEGVCQNCGSSENLEFDHIIPVARGGEDHISNMQILCKKCNLIKKDTHEGVFEYRKHRSDELFQSAVLDFISGDKDEAERKINLFKEKLNTQFRLSASIDNQS